VYGDNTTETQNNINICAVADTITRTDLDTYTTLAGYTTRLKAAGGMDDYLITRKNIYLEALNTIFNTNPDIILATLKYNMYYYNLVVYNVAIQYGLVKIQNERITPSSPAITTTTCVISDVSSGYKTTSEYLYGKIPITVAGQSAATLTNTTTLKFTFTSGNLASVKIANNSGIDITSGNWYNGTILAMPTFSKAATYLSTSTSTDALTITMPFEINKIFISPTDYNLTPNHFTASGTIPTSQIILYTINLTQLAIQADAGTNGSGPYAKIDSRGKIVSLDGFNDSLVNRNTYVVAPNITLSKTGENILLATDIIFKATDLSQYNTDFGKKNINLYSCTYNSTATIYASLPVLKPEYGITCPYGYDETPQALYKKTLTESGGSTYNINDSLSKLIENVTILSNELQESKQYRNTITKLSTTTTNNINTSNKFYDNQQDLNKTINEYNGELEIYNNISFYYKLVVAFAILLTIIIIIIFTTKTIDNNSKISVYAIIIVMIIIAFIIYKQYSGVKEGFTAIYYDSTRHNLASSVTFVAISNANSINNYKLAVGNFINKVLLSLTNNNIGESLNSSLTYIKKLSVVKNEKAEIYKIKKMNLMNSIEILKKNANFYYYMIIAISFSIIILNIGLILYLLNSAMIMQIIILCAVLFIILTYYISYYIHKSTRLAENKNYWSNYNPSSSTFNNL
jgi:hypothetical protein